ncbi:hypothetical protein ABE545_10805 [Sphingobacterium faecium]|uniref:hypothetical protein n=1 Tax=Sphingobacterium faecium TaxID=34087 RepID=UPI0032079590
MSIYSEISKRIGWDKDTKVSIPSIEDARDLHHEVMVNKSEEAYETVFRYQRFAPSADGGDDEVAMRFIHVAYEEGRRFFL